MCFEYSQYVRGCLGIPASVAIFAAIMLALESASFIKHFISHNVHLCDVMKYVLLLIGCLFFLCMNVGRLIHGGIYLLKERESDAIVIQGQITEIEGLGRFAFPELKSQYGYGETNGVQVTINGIQCQMPVKGSFEVGDYVVVSYLPQSGYVLSILSM